MSVDKSPTNERVKLTKELIQSADYGKLREDPNNKGSFLLTIGFYMSEDKHSRKEHIFCISYDRYRTQVSPWLNDINNKFNKRVIT